MRKGIEPYAGPIGPASAMSALTPEFMAAYDEAAASLLAAVVKFESVTGRVVDGIALDLIDVSTMAEIGKRVRQTSLHFLPTPGEVAW